MPAASSSECALVDALNRSASSVVDPVSTVDPFPELAAERERLTFARASRDRMIERLQRVDPQSAADEFTAEYVEVTVEEALDDLRSPGAGDFFGRIDTREGTVPSGGTSGGATSRTSATIPSSSTGGRRSPRRSTGPPVPTRWASTCAAASRSTPAS